MQENFFVEDGTSLYRQTFPWTGGNAYAYVWEFSRALVGTLALAGVPAHLVGGTRYTQAVQNRFAALENYWDGAANPPAYDSYVISQGGGDKYHDDNAWLALAFIQHYRMGLTTSLDRAKQLFTFARDGWDTNASNPYPGGIFWVDQAAGFGLTNHDRGTGATAGSAELGYHLQLLTGSTSFDGDAAVSASPASLGATNMADWVQAYVGGTGIGSGLYWNAVRADGSIDTNLWSYNQGVMIGANVLRHQLTGHSSHLTDAATTAGAALSAYADFGEQPPAFNAMLFQNLLMLYPYASASLQSSMLLSMQAYADWAWSNPSARDPRTNLFHFDDVGRPIGSRQPAQLRDQGAMTQVYALLAWSPTDYPKLT